MKARSLLYGIILVMALSILAGCCAGPYCWGPWPFDYGYDEGGHRGHGEHRGHGYHGDDD